MKRIDLSGPHGNAYSLMGTAGHIARQLGMTKPQVDAITTQMRSGDYHNLLTVLQHAFPNVELFYENDPRSWHERVACYMAMGHADWLAETMADADAEHGADELYELGED